MRIEMKIEGGGQTVAAFDYTEAQGPGASAGAGAGATAGAGGGHQQPFNNPGGNNAIAQQEAIVKMQQRTLAAMTAGSTRAPGRGNTGRGGARGGGTGRSNGGTRKPLAEIPMEDRPSIRCRRCYEWGQHLAHECLVPAEVINHANKNKDFPKPAKPFDKWFPNTSSN
jgi:hypothetical protein